MITNKRDPVKAWLRSRDIIVPDDWLAACLEWIEGEVQGGLQTMDQLKSAVYQQWLSSDLHELQCPCLPANVVTEKKFQLTGRYAVQIDHVVDVSKPYYGQMLKVKGAENDNMNVTAEPPAPWEPKPTRMLMLKITDGVNELQGMEYRHIAGIPEKLPPGIKAVIQGPVLCRNGVLMLQAGNIEILEGEADSLLEEGMPQNVLKRALERSMQYAGREHKQEFGGGPVWNRKQGHGGIKQEMPKTMYGSQVQRNVGTFPKNGSNTVLPVKMESRTSQILPTRKQEDEFDDDIALEDFLGDMSEFDSVPPTPKGKTSSSSGNQQSSTGVSTLPKKATTSKVLQLVSGTQAKGNVKKQSDVRSFSDSSVNPGQSKLNFPTKPNKAGYDLNARVGCEPPKSSTSSSVLPSLQGFNSGQVMKQSLTSQSSRPVTLEEDDLFGDEFEEELDDFDFTSAPLSKNTGASHQRGSSSAPSNSKKARTDDDLSDLRPEKVCKVEPSSDNKANNRIACKTNSTLSLQKNKVTSASKLSSAMKAACASTSANSDSFPTLSTTDKTELQSMTQGPDSGLMTRFTTLKMSPSAMLPVDAEPFTYLYLVKRQISLHAPMKFKVKAYISTLLDKLDYCDGKMWKLSCKINDGSDCMDVALSNAVLTQLIGFSAPDSLVMRKRAQNDPSVREILAEGVQQCQQKLIELLHVMEIQIHPDQDKPEVISIRMLSDSDINALETRVSEAIEKLSR